MYCFMGIQFLVWLKLPESCLHIFPFIYMSHILNPVFDLASAFYLSLHYSFLDCAYPLHSFCSHRHPLSQNQSQKRLHWAMCLHPLLQLLPKWVAIVCSHLQAKSQKMWKKRMSLVTTGVSCHFCDRFKSKIY